MVEYLRDEYLEDEAFVDELLGLVARSGSRQAAPQGRPLRSRQRKGARAWKAVSNVMFYAVLALACVAALFYGTGGGQGNVRDVAGFYIFNVLSPSMQREIPKGSLVLVGKIDPRDIETGQAITFFTVGGQKTITHQVIGIIEDFEGSGVRGFETQGVENPSPDSAVTRAENVIGVVRFHIPVLGWALQYVKDHPQLMLLWFGGLLALSFFLRIAFGPPRRKAPVK